MPPRTPSSRPMRRGPGGFTWDPDLGRYRDAGGRLVAETRVRDALYRAIDGEKQSVRILAQELRAGGVDLGTWQAEMRQSIKRVHLWSAAAAKGGWAQMGPADYGRVGQIVRSEYRYLDGFTDAIATGLPLDGRFLVRAAMYALAGKSTFYTVLRLEKLEAGYTEERNIRHAAESCDDCLAFSALGWVPIGTLPVPGTRQCLRHCMCTMQFRRRPSRPRR